jgi:hypothetical protein
MAGDQPGGEELLQAVGEALGNEQTDENSAPGGVLPGRRVVALGRDDAAGPECLVDQRTPQLGHCNRCSNARNTADRPSP